MPSSSSVRSSTEHCVSAPGCADLAADQQRERVRAARRAAPARSSRARGSRARRPPRRRRRSAAGGRRGSSRAPGSTASCGRASSASPGGSRPVSAAPASRAIFAGVMPAVSRVISPRGTPGSTIIRANVDRRRAPSPPRPPSRSMPWRAMNSSIRSNSASACRRARRRGRPRCAATAPGRTGSRTRPARAPGPRARGCRRLIGRLPRNSDLADTRSSTCIQRRGGELDASVTSSRLGSAGPALASEPARDCPMQRTSSARMSREACRLPGEPGCGRARPTSAQHSNSVRRDAGTD